MRELTARQKKALMQSVKAYCDERGSFPDSAQDLDNYDEIEAMNPCEIFWQNANRFVGDLRWNPRYDVYFRR
jgi:hypothetical protein